ncbi:MAG: carboxypeptidase-like regulatory domain-containing protein [Archangium sp.]|nr:carboxypeptidase-like regulatory domain-containing protein [Archangium sp.]MDP3153043.1 carboxypeptidase-like regulatory domain-containing protein [Archangium sp.]MDP3572569.1 carboxypeptidase-like regulatory domain-containing protein [Archangium sp.]
MNRHTLALVSVAVVFIVGGTWLLLTDEESPAAPASSVEQPSPAPRPLPVATIKVATPVEPLVVVEPVDAGVLAEVEIEVLEGGQQQIGVRVEIEGPSGTVGRPTDVMGYARFTLEPGAWRITSPQRRVDRIVTLDGGRSASPSDTIELALTTPFEVKAPLTRFRLELPVLHRVRGRVVDLQGAPVAGATVKWSPVEITKRGETLSDGFGQFTLETIGEKVQVQAQLGRARSTRRSLSVAGEFTLTLEPWTLLQVNVMGGGSDVARLRVLRHHELVAEGMGKQPLWVPFGELNVLARRNWRGAVQTGKTSIVVKDETPPTAEITLSASPPLRGRVVDATGLPVAGITVQARELRMFREETGEVQVVASFEGLTGHEGEFSIAPYLVGTADPVYHVSVTGLWRTTRPVLVRIDDAPLEVLVEPAPK